MQPPGYVPDWKNSTTTTTMEPPSLRSWYATPRATLAPRPQVRWLPLLPKEPARPGILKSRKYLPDQNKQQTAKTLRFSVDPEPAAIITDDVTSAVETRAEEPSEAPSTMHSPTLTTEEEQPTVNIEVPQPPLQASEHSQVLDVVTDKQSDVANSSEPSPSKSYTSVNSEGTSAKSPSAPGESAQFLISGNEASTEKKCSAGRSTSFDNRKKRVMRWFQQGMRHNLRSHYLARDGAVDDGVSSLPAFVASTSESRDYGPQEGETLDARYPRYASMAIFTGLLLFLVVAATTTLHQSLSGSDRDVAADRDNTLAPMGTADESAGGAPPRLLNGVVRSRPREDARKDEPPREAEKTPHSGLSTELAATAGDPGVGHKLADVQEITGSWGDTSLVDLEQKAWKRAQFSAVSLPPIAMAKRSPSRWSSAAIGVPIFAPNVVHDEASMRSVTPLGNALTEKTPWKAPKGGLPREVHSAGLKS